MDDIASPIVDHCRTLSFKKTRGLIFLYLTTIVTMIDNHFIIFMSAMDNFALPIVNHCQTLSNIVV